MALALNLMGEPANAAGGTGTRVGDIDCDGRPDAVAYSVTADAVRLAACRLLRGQAGDPP